MKMIKIGNCRHTGSLIFFQKDHDSYEIFIFGKKLYSKKYSNFFRAYMVFTGLTKKIV